ncbi:unnamed protein product, partial [Cladocopium goreaui]
VICNNLGGFGPEKNAPQQLHYRAVAHLHGHAVDVVLEAGQGYHPKKALLNGLASHHYAASVNVATNTEAQIELRFLMASHQVQENQPLPVKFSKLFLSIFDSEEPVRSLQKGEVVLHDVKAAFWPNGTRWNVPIDPQAAYVVPGGVAPVMLFEDVTSVSVTLTPKDYPGNSVGGFWAGRTFFITLHSPDLAGHWFAQAAPVRSLRLLVLVMAAPAAALEEELAAMETADAADLAGPAAEAAHPAGAPAAEAAHPAAAAPAVAEAARAAKAPAGPPDVAPLIEDYNEAEHGDDGPGPDELVVEGRLVHQSETGLLPAAQAAQSAALQRQRMDIAESVRQAVGSTFGLRMEGLLLGQEEIKHHAVARIHAPAIFNEVYDTSKDFSWAMFGFNTMVLSLTLQPSEANIVEEARDLLQLIPPHNSIPKKFSVLAAIVRELLQQFSEAGPCGGGALLCNIFILPFSMNGAARGYPLLEPEEDGEP